MEAQRLKALRKSFWEDTTRGHTWAQPASVIVNQADDPTTLFTTAGMQQFVPYLMGKEHPGGKRIYNIQKCVRTTDIEEVGDVSHLTCFEMMGNWSLGDYFKKESIAWSREFLTGKDWLGLDPHFLAVSVFAGDADAPKDEESAQLRKERGVATERIAYLGKKNNRRGPAGATGPCGPDTEIFFWIWPGEPPVVFDPDKDDAYWLEIWNNVFMAYYKDEQGNFVELQNKNVDTGMGFERLCLVMQCLSGTIQKPIREATLYDTDLFTDAMQVLSSIAGDHAKRVVADHLRTSLWLLEQGAIPSNEGRGYVLRRLIRRAFFQAYLTHKQETFAVMRDHIVPKLMAILERLYDQKLGKSVEKLLIEEMQQFASTIMQGERHLQDIIDTYARTAGEVKWADVFKLYDTYGFPLELTQEFTQAVGIRIDSAGFQKALEQAKEQSRQWSQQMFAQHIDWASHLEGIPPTQFVGYTTIDLNDVQLLKDIALTGSDGLARRVLIFDKTPFYATGGGQTGDKGYLELDSGERVWIIDVQKYAGVWLHFVW